MFALIITVHIISCFVLIAVILLQSGRGGGLSEAFGSSSSSTSTIFGTSASTFLQRATSVCAIVFLVTSLSLAVLSSKRSRSLMELQRIKRTMPQAQKAAMPVKTATKTVVDKTAAAKEAPVGKKEEEAK